MRPLVLNLQAFGPFAGTQTIDFTELGDRSLFLIHGPTGAGKTTILDALSFALFGESSGAERDSRQLRSDFADPKLPTEVSLTFRHGEKRYRITRRPAQLLAKQNGKGMTEKPPEAEFWQLSGNAAGSPEEKLESIAQKTGDCTKAIVELLGLDASQFRQVILIPQGQFRQFLLASTDEREKIFQTLFQTGRYRIIQDRLKSQAKDISERVSRNREKKLTLLEQSNSETSDALDQKINELQQTSQALATSQRNTAAALQCASERRNQCDLLLETLNRQAENQRQLSSATRTLGATEQAHKAATAELGRQEKLEPERKTARERATVLRQLLPQLTKYQSAAEEFAASEKNLASLQKDISDRNRAIEEQQALEKTLGEQIEKHRTSAAEAEALGLKRNQAAKLLDQRRQLDQLAGELKKAETKTAATEAEGKKLGARAANCKTQLKALIAQRHNARAASLAGELQPDAPCPVCGSTEHPAPAASVSAIPDDNALESAEQQLADAEKAVDRARDRWSAERDKSTALKSQLDILNQQLGEVRELSPAELAEKLDAADKAAAGARQAAEALKLGEKQRRQTLDRIEALKREQSRCDEQLTSQRTQRDRAAARRDELAEQIEEPLRQPGRLQSELAKLEEKIAAAEKQLMQSRAANSKAETNLATARARLAEIQKNSAALEIERNSREQPFSKELDALSQTIYPDAETPPASELLTPLRADLLAAETAARSEADRLNTEAGEISAQWKTCQSQRKQIAQLDEEHGQLEVDYRVSGRLSEVAGGDNPLRVTFQRFVLGALLDEVLHSASHRLHAMSRGRYQMYRSRESRRGGGLDLEVLDGFSGVARPVATLSGGESFLASLSLALGIADVTEAHAGGVRMETMFIDEGFGTLDSEALDLAFKTLYDLQQGGRLVGVISHVAELRERIDTRLEVRPAQRGSVAKFVV